MFYLLIFTHWIADFVCQSNAMATKKSKSNWWLAFHVSVYSLVLTVFGCVVMSYHNRLVTKDNLITVLGFSILNGLVHFGIDYYTSRMTSKLWADGEVHKFFVVIGFDQALHMCTLLATYTWMFT